MVCDQSLQRIEMSLTPLTSSDFENLLRTAGFFPFKNSMKIAVAVSGGADSLALTLLLNNWVKTYSGELVALTVDHRLRSDSSKEAQNLHNRLDKLGIAHHILTWEGEKPTTALQERARSKRYDLLESWCQQRGYPFLFLGHHQGDQSETYCMRLRRHSGLLGLACMRARSTTQRVTLVRPFLTTSKEVLRKTVKNFHIPWVEDPSNHNTHFERVFWRQILGKKAIDLKNFQTLRRAYDGWIQRYLTSYGTRSPLGYVRLQKKPFLELPDHFQEILLSHLLRAYGTNKYPLTSKTLSILLEKIQEPLFSAITAGGLKISSHQKELLLVREYRAITEEQSVMNDHCLWDKRFLILTKDFPQGTLKSVGEKGWVQLLQHEPHLKTIKDPRGALWSLPALWLGETIHPTLNMVHDSFLQAPASPIIKRFIFRSKSPF